MTLIILLILLCLILSAFFSSSETGLTSASPAIIHKLKIEGSRRAKLVSDLRERKERLIGAILLGNNAVNIAASALATSLAISQFGDDEVVLGAVTVVMTLVVLIFSEVMPKTYAIRNAEKVALAVAPLFVIISRVLSPVTIAVQIVVDGIFWVFGIRQQHHQTPSTEALRGAIELHHDHGSVVKNERDMLGSILDLEEIEVAEVMIHRRNMLTIDSSLNMQDIVDYVLNSPYTRIPVWKNNSDNIIGTIHVKNLVQAMNNLPAGEWPDINTVMSKPWFIPETTTLMEQLQAFRERHSHLAYVVDEYGALLGMVTLEDILEEIVGQIDDEYDTKTQQIRSNKDGSYTVDARISIRDFNRELGWNLPDEGASTIAGLIVHEAQLIPESGQIFHFHNCRFEILKRKRNQITSVRIRPFMEELGNES